MAGPIPAARFSSPVGDEQQRSLGWSLHQLKAEHAAVEPERPVKVRDLQVNVPDPHAAVYGPFGLTLAHHGP